MRASIAKMRKVLGERARTPSNAQALRSSGAEAIVPALAGFFLLALLASSAVAQVNDCSDPYWVDSLRCQADPSPGTLVPQPPVAPPAVLKEFTRVPLDGDPSLRCADGTVPILYVDEAEGAPSATHWVLTVPGGGACHAGDDGLGNLRDGQDCLDRYLDGEAGAMSTASSPAMRNLGTSGSGSDGIHSPDPVSNPFFSGFHRVRVQKCSYDRYNGRSTRAVDAEHGIHGSITYNLHQHGQRIWIAALEALRTGLVYDLYEDDGMGGITHTVDGASLSPLEDATRVLLVGHSSGANGMFQNADRLRDHMNGWAGFGGDVRVVFDANLLPALEAEAAFSTPVQGDLYDHVLAGTSLTVAPATGAYDATYYSDPTSEVRERFRAHLEDGGAPEDIYDASCVASHPGSPWRCADRFHVLFNHVTTPMFVRQDLSDPNGAHTFDGFGHFPAWGERSDYCHCPAFGLESPCIPVISSNDYRARVLEAATRLELDGETRSELATGADASGAMPTRYFFMPDCRNHGGAFNNEGYYLTQIDTGLSTLSFREHLEMFMAAPEIGAVHSIQHGVDGAQSICPPLPDPTPPPLVCPELPAVARPFPFTGLALIAGLVLVNLRSRLRRGGGSAAGALRHRGSLRRADQRPRSVRGSRSRLDDAHASLPGALRRDTQGVRSHRPAEWRAQSAPGCRTR